MHRYALVGKNISHSQSPQIYRKLIHEQIKYDLLDYPSEHEIPSAQDLFKIYDGINITSPYKKHFLNQVELSGPAKLIGAINCMKKLDGKILAENTDFPAVIELLKRFLDMNNYEVVILGDGVMAKLTSLALQQLNKKFKQYSRKTAENFEQLNLLDQDRQLIINTCSREYIFQGKITPNSIFWDYNYNNPKQELALKDKIHNYVDGLELLHLQAQYAVAFWSAN